MCFSAACGRGGASVSVDEDPPRPLRARASVRGRVRGRARASGAMGTVGVKPFETAYMSAVHPSSSCTAQESEPSPRPIESKQNTTVADNAARRREAVVLGAGGVRCVGVCDGSACVHVCVRVCCCARLCRGCFSTEPGPWSGMHAVGWRDPTHNAPHHPIPNNTDRKNPRPPEYSVRHRKPQARG
jgi:hypothetical protein